MNAPLSRRDGQEVSGLKEPAKGLLVKILEDYKSLDVKALTVPDKKFILDCYKVAIEEKLEAKVLSLSDLTYTDLEQFWEESLSEGK